MASGVCDKCGDVIECKSCADGSNSELNGVLSVDNADKRPQWGWWAPGNYENKCHICEKQFLGDKRARECAPCAYGDI